MNSLSKLFERLINRLMLSWRTSPTSPATTTHLEVERKFRISEEESSRLPDRLTKRGFSPEAQVIMTDTFLPTQNEGDMMRVRVETESGSARTLLTLKSWVKTEDGGKERQETEREIGGALGKILLLLGSWLNGSKLLSFSKHRQMLNGNLSGLNCVVSIDRVNKLGAYSGCYLEVEILVPVGDDVTPARQEIAACVAELLGEAREPVALSYMEMLKRSMQEPQMS